MIIFRVDGNSIVGTGHIMRCLSIAEAATSKGVESLFVLADDEPISLIQSKGYEAVVLGTDYANILDEIERFAVVVKRYAPETLLFDSYYVTKEYLDQIHMRIKVKKIVVIDDLRTEILPCDLLVHYALDGGSRRVEYECKYRTNNLRCPQLLLGELFAPMRSEFKNIRAKKISERIKEVLILSGGSDVCNISSKILHQIANSNEFKEYNFHIVIGFLCNDKEDVYVMAKNIDNVFIYENYKKMSHLMQNVDFAITAGGVTLMELCACGTPMGVYVCADNQLSSMEMCKRLEIPCVGDAREDVHIVDKMLSLIRKMDKDMERRKALSLKEQRVIDGKGSERIVDAII